MTTHTINRDGKPPLTFTGEILAKADNRDHNSTRWTSITIYRTKAGKFVAHIDRITQWQGETDYTTAEAFASFGEVIEWLRGDSEVLGAVSQEAVEKAIKVAPTLAEFWQEVVD